MFSKSPTCVLCTLMSVGSMSDHEDASVFLSLFSMQGKSFSEGPNVS